MKPEQQFTPDEDEGRPSMSRREFIKKGTLAGLGALLAHASPAEAGEKKKLPEVSMQNFAVLASYIEEKPSNYRKSCDMLSDNGTCDGSESSKPFEAVDFVIRAFNLKNPPEDPNNPIFRIIKKGETIEILIYTYKGEEDVKSTLKKDDANTAGLLWLLRAFGKVEKK